MCVCVFQDVLENEQIKLDWMFRYSIMQDIVRVSVRERYRGIERKRGGGETDLTDFLLRGLTVLGRGLIFQPVLVSLPCTQTCTL